MKISKSIGFVGAGIMGTGMVNNLLLNDFKVNVLAHRNRDPIDILVSSGARELTCLKDIAQQSDTLILCLPNSKTVAAVLGKLFPYLKSNTLIIDCTTNNVEAVKKFHTDAVCRGLRYTEAPLTGGKLQAETASLGAIVGCEPEQFSEIKMTLEPCCHTIERFGDVGAGATAKLISNFLAIGTATLVVEAMKAARDCAVDWEKFYKLASQGSGHSMSLDRIAPKAINGDYDGYVFSIANTLKDVSYINEFFNADKDYGKLAQLFLDIYQSSYTDGKGDKLLSNRLDPAHT